MQAEPVPELEARVLYSLIIFQNYTAITFKIQSRGALSGWDGGGRGFRAGGMKGWGPEEGFWEGSPHRLSDKHYKFNSYYYSF